MPRTALSDQTYRRLSAVVLLFGVGFSWIAVWSLKPYPTIYSLPTSEGIGFTPVVVGILVLFPIAFPIATSIFNPTKVMFSIAVALSLPLLFIPGRDMANVFFDNSEAKTVVATITAKRESGSWKTHNYLLQLAPQGDSLVYEVAVAYSFYQACTEGQLIAVRVHSGFLGRGWVSSDGNS